jgi:DNA-directed RNA polymerase subunit E'/Rpb7
MDSLYIYTKLDGKIELLPDQMNNDIYVNLKENIINKFEKKCYKNYGYICKICNFEKKNNCINGVIRAENVNCSSMFDVEFECKLCKPLQNKKIICKMDIINRQLLSAFNGPVTVIISSDGYDNNNFFFNIDDQLIYKKSKNKKILESGNYVKINIVSTLIIDKSDYILAMGYLIDMATELEIEQYKKDLD